MMRCLLVLAALTAIAHAGPPEFAHFEPERLVPVGGGAWLVGYDDCDEGGRSPAAHWLGPAPQPLASPVPTGAHRFEAMPPDPAIATLPASMRDRVRAVGRSADTLVVYAVGLGGFVAVSTDAAQHWYVQASHTKEDLDAVWVQSRSEVYAAGAHGTLIVARDDKPWTVDKQLGDLVRPDHTLYTVWGAGDDRYIAAFDQTFASHDGGKSWALMAGVEFQGIGGTAVDVVYGFGGPLRGLSVSRDRGKTWERLESFWWSGHRCYGG